MHKHEAALDTSAINQERWPMPCQA